MQQTIECSLQPKETCLGLVTKDLRLNLDLQKSIFEHICRERAQYLVKVIKL